MPSRGDPGELAAQLGLGSNLLAHHLGVLKEDAYSDIARRVHHLTAVYHVNQKAS